MSIETQMIGCDRGVDEDAFLEALYPNTKDFRVVRRYEDRIWRKLLFAKFRDELLDECKKEKAKDDERKKKH